MLQLRRPAFSAKAPAASWPLVMAAPAADEGQWRLWRGSKSERWPTGSAKPRQSFVCWGGRQSLPGLFQLPGPPETVPYKRALMADNLPGTWRPPLFGDPGQVEIPRTSTPRRRFARPSPAGESANMLASQHHQTLSAIRLVGWHQLWSNNSMTAQGIDGFRPPVGIASLKGFSTASRILRRERHHPEHNLADPPCGEPGHRYPPENFQRRS